MPGRSEIAPGKDNMGRDSRKLVLNAIGEQIDYLRRTSRLHALGIKVGLEESVKGFSQSEDVVVSVYIPYCEAGSEWEVVIDSEAPERCPDLVPMPATEAEVGKGFTQGILEAYDLYRLSALASLKSWDLFRRPESLLSLAVDIKHLRRDHEVKKLANSPIKSAYFHFESVRDRQEEVEVLVSRAGVRMVFPLWKDPKEKEEKEGDYEASDAGPVFVYGRASIRIRLEWTEIDGKRPDVRIIFPPEAQGLARGFRQPGWTSEMTLYDYLPQVQAAVARPWRERKQLVAAFAARHCVLEYDAQDFTSINLFMKVKIDNFVHLRILRLDIGPDFPHYPPLMTLCDALSDQSWPLDRRDYLYSPRWNPERMVTELYKYAAGEVANVLAA